ncbi:MAG: sugar phosphate isomerase/epimerase [Lentisphaeria bacterium]|nr:sugar phosphate isomerase/epimerase [Lentisphaeria bacterium]
MQYGMNFLLWTDLMHDGLIPVLENVKSMGYDGVELPIFELDTAHWEKWGKILDDMGLRRTAVTVRGEDENPISMDDAIQKAGTDANLLTVDCCEALGAETLCGPYHSAIGIFSGEGPTDEEWARGVDSMKQVADRAGKANVMLACESLNRFETYLLTCIDDAVRFVEAVDHPNCRLMYDTFHANIEEKDPIAAIKRAAPYMAHVHISENDRSTPGQGNIPWEDTWDALKEVNYDGWLTVEAFGLALPAIAAATKIWRKMYDSEEQLASDGLAFMKAHVDRRW